jgi:hypothetical protein
MLFGRRVSRRLQVFPFTLVFVVLYAIRKVVVLRRRRRLAAVAEAKTCASPVAIMLWLDRVGADAPAVFDACLKLPGDQRTPDLHDVFSVLLASPRLRSVALYWDEAALEDDLPLWVARQDRRERTASGRDPVDAPGAGEVEAFLRRTHADVTTPVAAMREGLTLLKRLAGADLAVCLNLPAGVEPLASRLAVALPPVRFLDLGAPAAGAPGPPPNLFGLHAWGLTLHERMALVRGVDAYVGRLDTLGVVAVMSGRPTVLVADAAEVPGPGEALDGRVVWLLADSATLAADVLGFLDRHCRASSGGAPRHVA